MVPEYADSRNGAKPPGDEMRLVVNLNTGKAMVLTLPSGGRRPRERANRTELAMSALGPKRTFVFALRVSAIGGKADMPFCTFGSDECPL